MKVKLAKDAIVDALLKVQTIVSTRSTIPVLYNVHIQAKDDRVTLTTTDLEVSIQTDLEARVIDPGSTTLPARKITSILRELPVQDIQMDVNDRNVATIKAGSSTFKLIGISSEEFPKLPEFKQGNSYSLDQGVFREMLRTTAYAASNDETRYVLNGVLLSFKGDKLTAVATDGRRLALVDHEVEFPSSAEGELVVPSKTVAELVKTLGGEGPLKIQTSENQVAFEFTTLNASRMLVVSKLIDGNYPNFRQVIPSHTEERIPIEREQLLNTVRRVSLMTSDKGHSIKVTVSENKLTVTAISPDIGEAVESIPVKYAGKTLNVAFNPEFLMDPLRNMLSEEIFLELTDEMSPGVIKCDTPFLYVLMPMRMT